MSAILKDNVLHLHGDVGPSLFGDGFTASDVSLALARIDDDADLSVRISSGGGYADDGTAIYNALRARAGKTHITVTGIAASAASLIVMAGDRISMAEGAVLMAHEPMVSLLNANGDDLASAAAAQAAYLSSYVGIYARRSKLPVADIKAMLKQTVWFDAEGAVAAGFADDIEGVADAASPAFDYAIYAKAPERLVAMASAKHWQLTAAAPLDPKAEKARADRAEAELAEVKASIAERDQQEAAIAERERRHPRRADGRLNGEGLTGGGYSRPRSQTPPSWDSFKRIT